MRIFKLFVFTVIFLFLTCSNLVAQNEESNTPVEFYLGGSYTIAPRFDIDGNWTVNTNASANFYSLFADLVVNKNLIGRAQVSFLSLASLPSDLAPQLESGFEMNGSLGYNIRFENNHKINIPLMATLGFATVTDKDSRDAGMQLGGTMGFNYSLSNRIVASSSLRYLSGTEFQDGAKFDQFDVSIGIQFKLL